MQIAKHAITPSFEQSGGNKCRSAFSFTFNQRCLDSTRTEFYQSLGRQIGTLVQSAAGQIYHTRP